MLYSKTKEKVAFFFSIYFLKLLCPTFGNTVKQQRERKLREWQKREREKKEDPNTYSCLSFHKEKSSAPCSLFHFHVNEYEMVHMMNGEWKTLLFILFLSLSLFLSRIEEKERKEAVWSFKCDFFQVSFSPSLSYKKKMKKKKSHHVVTSHM